MSAAGSCLQQDPLCAGLSVYSPLKLTPDKLNFSPEKADEIEALHARVAKRLRWVIDTNQGLYLKLGQALGLQAALLPKPYREAFSHVFDNAPSVPYSEVVGVFKSDLGIDPKEIFEEFSPEPLASASIAQVHKAKLRPERGDPDREVAVKVQKPAIQKQMNWDLFSYRCVAWGLAYRQNFELDCWQSVRSSM